ncbi:MAG: ORF6N domain-containing protein [Flavobacteriales bacterium]|nr:ORF6N domain-containing protein [Flavobacteriales bacterium]
MSKKNAAAVSEEVVMSRIHTIRGHKVMLDSDLAELYEVATKALKQAVRRNLDSFPEDFMFELTPEEWENLRSQNVTSSHGGARYPPMAFSEHGVMMLSSVLKSDRARRVNIQIMRLFVRMREVLSTHKELLLQLEKLRGTVSHNSRDIKVIFNHLKRMQQEEENRRFLAQVAKKRPPIGFKKGKDKS